MNVYFMLFMQRTHEKQEIWELRVPTRGRVVGGGAQSSLSSFYYQFLNEKYELSE
jgi:hypothetical protein